MKKWQTKHDQLSDAYLKEIILPLSDIESNIYTYPTANMEEETLLPAIKDRIENECNILLLADFFIHSVDSITNKSMEHISARLKLSD
ncbi:MAG: hypothetical protein RSA21_07170, partial [Akkermansia sp.]